jgi:hypothetical protein
MHDREARPQSIHLIATAIVGEHDGTRRKLSHVTAIHKDNPVRGEFAV